MRGSWMLSLLRRAGRRYATISSSPPVINRPLASKPPPAEVLDRGSTPSQLDNCILSAVESSKYPFPTLVRQYLDNVGHVLDASLKYESRPPLSRSLNALETRNPMVLVAHCVKEGADHKISIASGFALEVSPRHEGQALVLTCAHTFEEASNRKCSYLNKRSHAILARFVVLR